MMASFVTEWANDGFAVEVDRNKAAIAALPSLKAAFAPESSTTFYRAKLTTWPLPAPLPLADGLLGEAAGSGSEMRPRARSEVEVDSEANRQQVGVPVYSRPSFTIQGD